jgi:NAD(P)H-hydrate epimerase
VLTLTRQQVRRIDQLAISEYGIPGVVLMENAARSAAEAILAEIKHELKLAAKDCRVAILCGGGNNGGDGYVIARHLHIAGVPVAIYSAIEINKLTGDAAINAQIAQKMQLELHDITHENGLREASQDWEKAQILVDALLGTGFQGELRPELANIVRRCNAVALHGKRVIAIDLPSGLDCDSGEPSAATIRADVTVTFVARKVGFDAAVAKPFIGRVVVVPIGAPNELIDRVAHE